MVLSIFRIMTGLLLFQYGVAKLLKFPAVPDVRQSRAAFVVRRAAMFELVLGGLLILGLFTRPVAFILCGEMAFAYFIGTFPRAVSSRCSTAATLAIMFCFACLYLACAGGGPWSARCDAGQALS